MSISWNSIGEIQVSDNWQLFPSDTISDTFRITTTITDTEGWNRTKIQSGAYIRFIYPDEQNTKSKPVYIPVRDEIIVYELPVPHEMRGAGYYLRSISCRFSSKWVGKLPLASFAGWKLKVEGFLQ
ncbi:hypothetical protein [Nostoc sp. DSM 114167]|jgi:hypothetical protein|uniref:hypothetical protein n=1 Tax=Nostoc sp. DSM 114167 TaxID=3439050 RepID=UPI0040463B79